MSTNAPQSTKRHPFFRLVPIFAASALLLGACTSEAGAPEDGEESSGDEEDMDGISETTSALGSCTSICNNLDDSWSSLARYAGVGLCAHLSGCVRGFCDGNGVKMVREVVQGPMAYRYYAKMRCTGLGCVNVDNTYYKKSIYLPSFTCSHTWL